MRVDFDRCPLGRERVLTRPARRLGSPGPNRMVLVSTASLALTIPLAVVLLLLAGLSGTVGLRGRAGALSRDGRMGVRTPASMASDEAFGVANRVAAPVALGAAAIAALLAVLILVLPVSSAGALILFVVALAVVFTLLLLAGALGDRAARHVPIPARRPAADGAGCGGCGCGGGGCSKLTRNTEPAAGSA